MISIKDSILHNAVRMATAKPVPERYSLSDEPGRRFDFTYFKIYPRGTDESFLAKEYLKEKGLEGIIFEKECAGKNGCLPFSKLADSEFEIKRIYRDIEIAYKSPFSYFIGEYGGKHLWIYWKRRQSQRAFNKRFEFNAERMNILKGLVGYYRRKWSESNGLFEEDYGLSAVDIFSKFYKTEIWGHPNYRMFLKELEFVLDSLVVSGDLSKDERRYKLNAKALQTLAQFF